MVTMKEWEFAMIGQDEARQAQVNWVPGRRLPGDLVPIAMRLGYAASELDSYSIGELDEDLVIDNAVYGGGAIMLPDELGYPAPLVGKPLVKSPQEMQVGVPR